MPALSRLFFVGLFGVLAASSASTALAASTLRCGSTVVSLGDRTLEVQDKCGEAQSRDFLGYRSVGKRSIGFAREYFAKEEVGVEEWSYRMPGGMRYFLRFEGNRLVDIQSKRIP